MAVRRYFTKPGAPYDNTKRVGVSDANAELARLRRIMQYETVIFPPSRGGGGGGGGSKARAAAFSEFEKNYVAQMNEITKDLADLNTAYRLGYVSGAQRDTEVIKKLEEYKAFIGEVVNMENNPVLQARAEDAPKEVQNWIEKQEKTLSDGLAMYGYNPEYDETTDSVFKDDSKSSYVLEDNARALWDRKSNLVSHTTKDGVEFMSYIDSINVDENGKIVENIDKENTAIDIWTENGYEQVTVAEIEAMDDYDYYYGADPYTGNNTFYLVEESKEIVNPEAAQYLQQEKTQRTIHLKGPNNMSFKGEFDEEGNILYGPVEYPDGTVQPVVIDLNVKPNEEEFKALMAHKHPSVYKASTIEQKAVYDQMYIDKAADVSGLPVAGSWFKDNEDKLYYLDGDAMRPLPQVEGWKEIAESWGYAEGFTKVKELPGAYFQVPASNVTQTGLPLELKDLEEEEELVMDQGPEIPLAPEEQPQQDFTDILKETGAPGLQPSLTDITESFGGTTPQPTQPEPPQEPEEEESQGWFNNLLKKLF